MRLVTRFQSGRGALEVHDTGEREYAIHPAGKPLPQEKRGDLLEVQGEGVTEIAVGPVHAGIIEPGHFRFSVMGDLVLHLELRLLYTHKGVEKLFQGRTIAAATPLAESVSGDECFSHAVAYCQAVERACRVSIPARAAALRLVGLELERLAAHIGDVGALANDVAFTVAAASAARLKESLLQASAAWAGTRYWRGLATPGGLARDIERAGTPAFARAVAGIAREFAELAALILETPSVQSRFDSAGVLARKIAHDLGVVGVVARASGIAMDVRRDHPYCCYEGVSFETPQLHYGDVLSRARIRIEEAAISARLIQETLASLPGGPVQVPVEWKGRAEGWSAVEAPRGELFFWIEGTDGVLELCHIQSPSHQNWPALPHAVAGNIIADFPLINKSFNLSYSGSDR